jgi:FMN phosphatase YigB (HAD superfamily)
MIKRPAWIFDVDGTLVDVEPIIHMLLNQDRKSESFKKNYDLFQFGVLSRYHCFPLFCLKFAFKLLIVQCCS